jgi:hypothetical protein
MGVEKGGHSGERAGGGVVRTGEGSAVSNGRKRCFEVRGGIGLGTWAKVEVSAGLGHNESHGDWALDRRQYAAEEMCVDLSGLWGDSGGGRAGVVLIVGRK